MSRAQRIGSHVLISLVAVLLTAAFGCTQRTEVSLAQQMLDDTRVIELSQHTVSHPGEPTVRRLELRLIEGDDEPHHTEIHAEPYVYAVDVSDMPPGAVFQLRTDRFNNRAWVFETDSKTVVLSVDYGLDMVWTQRDIQPEWAVPN